MDFYGHYFWESQDEYVKPAIGGSMLFINNARVVINTVFAGIFDRFPELQMVSVESGIGWVPFILETMDYELMRTHLTRRRRCRSSRRSTSEDWYATFWFENNQGDVQGLLDKVGDDRVLFETDFPHPTCLYPAPLETVAAKMNTLVPRPGAVMGENRPACTGCDRPVRARPIDQISFAVPSVDDTLPRYETMFGGEFTAMDVPGMDVVVRGQPRR